MADAPATPDLDVRLAGDAPAGDVVPALARLLRAMRDRGRAAASPAPAASKEVSRS